MRVALLLSAALAALVLAGSAGAGQSYLDRSGEVGGSADIGAVAVSNDLAAGTLTFQVGTNWPGWDPNTFFAILVDSDQNAATGTAGFDYVLTGNRLGGTVVNTVTPHVAQAQSSLAGGVWTLTVNTADIGNPQAISFFALTQVGPDPAHPLEDRAPDTGTWTYSLVPPPPPPPPVPTVSAVAPTWIGSPIHGKRFRVTGLMVALSDGTKARAFGVGCSATLAGKRIAGVGSSGCTFRLPKAARGRKLVVNVVGSYAAAPVRATYASRVR
jgi:hypothetical protein